MPKITVNQAEYYYELHGAGHPLVLIAGYACDHTFWMPILDLLSKHFQVLIFDNRGIGQTKDQSQALSIEMLADDVLALAQQLNFNHPHVVGHSMGGAIAQSIAARYGDKIKKVGIISSAASIRPTMLYAFHTLLQMRKANIDFDIIFKAMLPWIFGDQFLSKQENIETLKNAYVNDLYPQSIANQERQFNMLQQWDGLAQLHQIHSPVLLVRGDHDVVCLKQEFAVLREALSPVKTAELACAHGMTLEVPIPFAEVLVNFLAG